VLTTGSALVFDGTNFGSAVTPSAWRSNYRALQVGNATGVVGRTDNNNNYFSSNWYVNSSNQDIYQNTGFATLYSQGTGTHAWYNAASGTAGNAISFTQAMTLDASGRLGIANTSPSVNLEIGADTSTVRALAVRYSSVPAYLSNSYDGTLGLSTLSANNYNTSNGSSSWSAFQNTGFGSSAIQLAVSTGGADIRFLTAAAANTNPTERARIDSSGNLLVGTTDSLDSTGVGIKIRPTSTTSAITCTANTNGGLSTYHFYNTNATNNGYRFFVNINGGISNYQANDVNLSDRREKTNFAPAKSYLDTICAIPVQTFNYIDQNMEDDLGLTLGVVAQDVQAVAPELVSESNWGTEEDPKMRLSIYQTDLQYALMKCIQEQQALITQLTARITALESA